MHAAQAWQAEHPGAFERWHRESNTVVIVTVPSATVLVDISSRAAAAGATATEFRDDDLPTQLTAVAVGPPTDASAAALRGIRRLCHRLQLAFKEAEVPIAEAV